jgi:hypothetical protein
VHKTTQTIKTKQTVCVIGSTNSVQPQQQYSEVTHHYKGVISEIIAAVCPTYLETPFRTLVPPMTTFGDVIATSITAAAGEGVQADINNRAVRQV